MGLINARSIGAGMVKAADTAQPFLLNMQQSEIQEARERRLLELAAEARKNTGKELASTQEAILKPRQDQIARNLEEAGSDTAARDFVANESGITDKERAEAGSQAASKLGLIEYQNVFDNRVRDIDRTEHEKRRDEAMDKRAEQDVSARNKQFDIQMAKLDKQMEHAKQSENNAQIKAQASAVQESVRTSRDLAEKALLKLSSPEVQMDESLKAFYTKEYNRHVNDATAGAAALMEYGKTGKWSEVTPPAGKKDVQPERLVYDPKTGGFAKPSSSKTGSPEGNGEAVIKEKPSVKLDSNPSLLNIASYSRNNLNKEAAKLRDSINSGKLSSEDLFVAKVRLKAIEDQLSM